MPSIKRDNVRVYSQLLAIWKIGRAMNVPVKVPRTIKTSDIPEYSANIYKPVMCERDVACHLVMNINKYCHLHSINNGQYVLA